MQCRQLQRKLKERYPLADSVPIRHDQRCAAVAAYTSISKTPVSMEVGTLMASEIAAGDLRRHSVEDLAAAPHVGPRVTKMVGKHGIEDDAPAPATSTKVSKEGRENVGSLIANVLLSSQYHQQMLAQWASINTGHPSCPLGFHHGHVVREVLTSASTKPICVE